MKKFKEVKEQLKSCNVVSVSDRYDLWHDDNMLMVYDKEICERVDHTEIVVELRNIHILSMYVVIRTLEKGV